jgi:protoheme IX farnesyltransferase
MSRTCNRPIPLGLVEPGDALAFGIFLMSAAVLIMGLTVNIVAAGLLAFSIAFYVFIYTIWLKRRTPHNIVIGGAAGAFPPLIGWAAVTGDISPAGLVLFALIFIWTPSHFWALSLFRHQEYVKANVPMLPVIYGPRETKRQMLIYTSLLLPLGIIPWAIGAAVLNGLFLICAVRVWHEDSDQTGHKAARQMFSYSNFYLFAVFALLITSHPTGLEI